TYREIELQANSLSHALRDRGVSRGDRVAIYLENSPQAAVSIFAILKAGAVFLLIHPSAKPQKLAYILQDCKACALITDSVRAPRIQECRAAAPHLRFVLLADIDAAFVPAEGDYKPP